jgi:diguanylate cyclase (GGDEF)-like protein
MVLMAVVLYLWLTAIMVYTYLFRKTYPGFGSFTIGQILWSVGIFTIFFRFLGEKNSLAVGNLLLVFYAGFWYRGIVLYGEIENTKWRNISNIGIALVTCCVQIYFIFIDFDTCSRVIVFSLYFSMIYFRIALEPYCVKRWKIYSTQPIFSGGLLFIGLLYLIRVVYTWGRTDCLVGGSDSITKFLLAASMFLIPLLTYSLLSMTSGRVEVELGQATTALRHQAETDALTGLTNRRHFLGLAQQALDAAREGGRPLSLLMLDLDHFKDINDSHGHQAGDLVLRAVARCLGEVVREFDTVGRLGGEEFGILLPGLDAAGATRVAHRLRRAVAELHPGGYTVTTSLGVATGTDDVDALLARADECLYAAKGAGRNRVSFQDAATGQAVVAEETS